MHFFDRLGGARKSLPRSSFAVQLALLADRSDEPSSRVQIPTIKTKAPPYGSAFILAEREGFELYKNSLTTLFVVVTTLFLHNINIIHFFESLFLFVVSDVGVYVHGG